MMGSIPPKQVPRSKLPRWASRWVMNIPEETPQGFTPSPLSAAARSSTRPSHLLCICHPKGQKNTKNLCLSPSPAADPLLLAACGAGDELPLEAPAAAAGPAPPPRPRAEPAGPLEKNLVKYFYLFIHFFSTVHNTFVENEFLFS